MDLPYRRLNATHWVDIETSMASYYWIKLYHEILDDPKMGRLSDHLWRRTIEMFLFAGKEGGNGEVPCIVDMAWSLRTTPAELQADLDELERIGIIRQRDGADPFVVHFEERQAPVPPAERKRRQRERERHEQYTGVSQDCHEPVTIRTTELDQSRVESDQEEDNNAADAAPSPAATPAEVVFLEVFGPFAYEQDRKDILAVEVQVGSQTAEDVIRWAKRKHISSDCVIQSIVTAAGKWATGPPGDNGRGDRSSNATLQAIQELEAEVNGGFG